MATAAAHLEPDGPELARQMARNVRSLANLRGMKDKDVAAAIGISAPKMSSRLSGDSGWQVIELLRIARFFGVSLDVIYAASEAEFRSALAKTSLYKCETPSDLLVSSPVALVSSRTRPDGRFRRSSDRPLMAAAST